MSIKCHLRVMDCRRNEPVQSISTSANSVKPVCKICLPGGRGPCHSHQTPSNTNPQANNDPETISDSEPQNKMESRVIFLHTNEDENETFRQQIVAELSSSFAGNFSNCVFKFKNVRGSHVVISVVTVKQYGLRNPLVVEICNMYSKADDITNKTGDITNNTGDITPPSVVPMSVERQEARKALVRSYCQGIEKRISTIEREIPFLSEHRKSYLEVSCIAKKLSIFTQHHFFN